MQEYDDSEPELITPEDFLPPDPFPVDARRMGFDRFTGDNGALIAMAAALDGRKASHRFFAWVMLVVIASPVVLELARLV